MRQSRACPHFAPVNASRQTFRDVYLSHFDFVRGTVRRLGVREQDAPDLTQKVFIIVYMKLAAFEYRSSLRTWLFRVCLNACRDYQRSAAVRREVATEPTEIDHLANLQEGTREDSESQRRLTIAAGIMNKLPEAQRSVFVLFELEEMSGAEIAELLGVSTGTVRSRIRLARKTFAREARRVSAREREAAHERPLESSRAR
ncbi:MAG TPA: sigma-70 family RNA polymerase sigma factor [Polyangiaceae bacterium]|nr:sigma-70 family RNA polymerase sigma factor [Polyangiaceae bacterium]